MREAVRRKNMPLNNTSDRYNYIYGNAVRKLEIPFQDDDFQIPQTGIAAGGISPARKTVPYPLSPPSRKPRRRRKAENALDFDWKYTVILTVAAFVIIASAIFYVRGTVVLHDLGGQITTLKEERTRLQGKQTALKNEIDKATNLEDIRTYAMNKLGLVYPDSDHILYYADDNDDYMRQYDSVDTGR